MAEEREYLRIPGHVSVMEAARMLGISYDRAYQLVQLGRLASKKVGGKHMISEKAIEDFKHNPPGRVRKEPPKWRTYDKRIKLFQTEIKVQVRAEQQKQFEQKVKKLLKEQQHRFTGTAERYFLKNTVTPDLVTLIMLWKDNEMPDEATRQRELEAFKADFADVLDWETAEISLNEGMIYT